MHKFTVEQLGWGAALGAAAGLQLWWWTGDGPAWLPVLTGPSLAAAVLGINGSCRRRSDPESAALAALRSGGYAEGGGAWVRVSSAISAGTPSRLGGPQ